jgi:flagellar motor component MotA
VFGAKHAMVSTAMLTSYVVAGGLMALIDVRAVFVIAGAGGLLAAGLAVRLLRGVATAAPLKSTAIAA